VAIDDAENLMILAAISPSCPQCGSKDVYYSCKPECCFNHVCNNCYTTFELETVKVGEVKEDFAVPPAPDPTAPAAPCARCHEPKVFAISDSATPPQYVCAGCRALLMLQFTEVSPGYSTYPAGRILQEPSRH
jgi:hypothetical protein